ncbi:hypothetical protein MTATph1_CDS0066 [Moorella phage MTATph1]
MLRFDYWHLPRHVVIGRCSHFIECPLCFKCRGFDLKYVKCQNCPIAKCDITYHTEAILSKMIKRPSINLEEQ